MGLMRAIKLTWMICIFIGTGFITEIASADIILYGTTSDGDSGISSLVTIDPANGSQVGNAIGSVGYLVNGMAWDPGTQTLYASTSTNDPAFTGLIVINRQTGEGESRRTPNWGQGAGFSVSNITIDSKGHMTGWADNTNQLVEIDKETGEITTFINTSVSVVDCGLSYDKYNLLYMVNSVDNGDNSVLHVFVDNQQDFDTGPSIFGYESRQGDFHPTSNFYYGIDHTGTDTRSLVTIRVDTNDNNFRESYETVDLLQTLAFVVTGGNDNSDSGTCFIHCMTNTD